jgi:hypothetical protein
MEIDDIQEIFERVRERNAKNKEEEIHHEILQDDVDQNEIAKHLKEKNNE